MSESILLRNAVIDDDLIKSLRRLVIEEEPLVPEDLWKIELAIRAFVLVDDLHTVPHLVPIGMVKFIAQTPNDGFLHTTW